MWNCGSAKRMLRGNLNLSRSEETAGILLVTWSITIRSIAAMYELSRDCNLILRDWTRLPRHWRRKSRHLMDAFLNQELSNFLDTKLACDPQSNKVRHNLREPSLLQMSTIAIESMTYSLLNDPEAWVARTKGGGIALDATSLSILLVDGSAEGMWSSVLCFVWQTLYWPEVHLLDAWEEERKQLTQSLRLRISAALYDTGSATKFLQ